MTRADAWGRFWFEPVPGSTLAVVRIAFGLVMLAWGASLGPDLATLYGPAGLVDGARACVVVYALLLAGAAAMVAGYRTRVASAAVFGALLWFDEVNPWALNSGDAVLRYLAFVLMLAPQGPRVGVWGLRLIQLQLSAIYVAAVAAKLQGDAWREGIATSLVLSVPDITRFPTPDLLISSPVAAHLLTWGTLALEAAIAVLVWNRRMRPWVLAGGAGFHLMIEFSLRVGFFSWAMLVCYLAFLTPERATSMMSWRLPSRRPFSPRMQMRPDLAAVAWRRRLGRSGSGGSGSG